MFKIIKLLNHNSVIVYETKEDETLLVLHKGVGFGQKINAIISLPKDATIFRIEPLENRGKQDKLLNNLDPIYIEVASDILLHAEKTMPNIKDYKILPLADHIAFAIQRIQQNLKISNPFSHEIKSLYPEAWKIATISREIIFNKLGYLINDDEIAFITLHLQDTEVNSRDEGFIVAMIVGESIQEIEKEYDIEIDVNSLSYSRLMVHLKFLIARLQNKEELGLDMEDFAKEKIPEAYKLAQRIVGRISKDLKKDVPSIETGYLALHIDRIITEAY